jgi:hypothetical protein
MIMHNNKLHVKLGFLSVNRVILVAPNFFFEMEAMPQPQHQSMHTAVSGLKLESAKNQSSFALALLAFKMWNELLNWQILKHLM